ncbi:Universal stress protein UspA and nucleotide-binding proteins [Balamuthia mandrillaris]
MRHNSWWAYLRVATIKMSEPPTVPADHELPPDDDSPTAHPTGVEHPARCWLVCLDGSPASNLALRRTLFDLAEPSRGDQVILYVVHCRELHGQAENILTLAKELVDRNEPRLRGLSVEYLLEQNPKKERVAQRLLKAMQGRKVDYVVMGNRGRGWLKSKLLGSVATEVLKRSPVPVMIIRHPLFHPLSSPEM